ncbi:MAG: hypothetical protein LBD79_08345 [Treponema sp.]|nr:hypothetical protein [Treponema sp.]
MSAIVPDMEAKRASMSAERAYVSAKAPDMSAERAYVSAKAPDMSAELASMSAKVALREIVYWFLNVLTVKGFCMSLSPSPPPLSLGQRILTPTAIPSSPPWPVASLQNPVRSSHTAFGAHG